MSHSLLLSAVHQKGRVVEQPGLASVNLLVSQPQLPNPQLRWIIEMASPHSTL